MGLYDSELDWIGKWEWDLVRSVRLVLEVGINTGGWSDDEALMIWRKYIPNQESIAKREIARIRRWPGQVVSYKVGEFEVFKLKKKLMKLYGNKFNLKEFHQLLVEKGSLPLPVLSKYVLENYH